MQKIKRTDVRRRGAGKSLFKTIIITLFLILLFLVGFLAAAFLTKLF